MPPVVIENPVLNSPYLEPERHFKFTDDGITNEIMAQRRVSSYFVPIPPARKRAADTQLSFNEWTNDRVKPNDFINRIRGRVNVWRQGGYASVTRTTARLLEHWNDKDRDKRLFFCQIEALETAVYIAEAAKKFGDHWIDDELRTSNADANPELFRIAFKLATGTGKTNVMAMLIAWQALNKFANPQDAKFSDAFLIIAPGITIKDRLRVLLPSDPENYYKYWDLVPKDILEDLGRIKIIITNYHAFMQREKISTGKITKNILTKDTDTSPFTESPDEMVRRVCREFGNKTGIVVINDEAHHCYRHKAESDEEKLKGDDLSESKKREEAARVWISGIEAVKRKLGVKAVYDLSATPFFLRGSGYQEGNLFGWVASDFSLIDAIESGIVKVPRVPVSDDSMQGEAPTYRELWLKIREDLPKKGRATNDVSGGEPILPKELQGALHSLYDNYKKYYDQWKNDSESQMRGQTPPVFIVICNNTNVSKLVYDYVAGWEKQLDDSGSVLVPGALDIFSNVNKDRWFARPNTVLIDSEQLDSGDAMSKEFKDVAKAEIDAFKHEMRLRNPGLNVDSITDEDLLREVMNTVGKPGKLGEQIKCVVSVSMLTEGWDANTVTHILGVRAFGTQLLCEQVVGRGLRRRGFATEQRTIKVGGQDVTFESFSPEYAEVYGVPFSFIPTSGSGGPVITKEVTRVRALEERFECEIHFPRVVGYRYELPQETVTANFTEESHFTLSTADIPTKVENAPIVGETAIHTLDELREKRAQEVAFKLAKLTLDYYSRDPDADGKLTTERPWLFPPLLAICRQWVDGYVHMKDNTFVGMLLLHEIAYMAADKIYQAIVRSTSGEKRLLPVLRPYDTLGSTRFVDFTTTRPTYRTREDKCHISHVVADTESWEQKMAQTLEYMDEVICYVKNQGLGFTIPYTYEGKVRNYVPDFIIRFNNGQAEPLNLILEVSGEAQRDKEVKVSTARTMWIPAINNHGGFGRWAFAEISDPWDAERVIRHESQSHEVTNGV